MAADKKFSMAFELGAKLASSFNAAFKSAQGRMNKLKSASESLNRASSLMGNGILAAGSAAAVAAGSMFLYVNSVAQADAQVRTLAESVGANVKEIEYLSAAIAPLGMDFEKAVDLQEEFVNKWGESRALVNKGLADGMELKEATDEAVGGMKDAYAMLGLDLAESIKKPADVAAKEFYDAILKHGNNAEAQSAADIMLGGDANKIFGHLRKEGFKTMDGLNERFGALDSRTDESRANLEKFASSMNFIKFATSSLSKEFAGLLGGALQPVVEKAQEWMKANKQLVGVKLKEWADNIAKSIQWVINNFEQIVFWTKTIAVAVGVFMGLAAVIKAVTIATTIFNLVMMANPIVLIVAGVALLAAGFYYLIKRMGGVTGIWEKVKTAFGAGINFIKSIIQSVDNFFAENPIMNFIMPIIGVPRLIIAHWSSISGFFSDLWGGVKNITSTVITAIVGFVTNMPIVTAFTTVFSKVIAFLTTIKDKMLQIGSNIVQGLIDGIKSRFEGLKSVWDKVNSWIPDFARKKMDIHSPSRVMSEIGGHITGGLGVGIQEGFPSVQGTMDSGMNSLMPNVNTSAAPLSPSVVGNSAPITITVTQNITGDKNVAEQAQSGLMDAVKQIEAHNNRNNRLSFA